MKFTNEQELQEAHAIINKLWGRSWTVYSSIKMDVNNYTISFTADSYFDPVLLLLTLNSKNIVNAKFEWAGEEKDRVIITGCNLDILKRLSVVQPDLDYKNITTVLDGLLSEQEKIDLAKQSDDNIKPEQTHIVLADITGERLIPIKDWNEYWAKQGKTGPTSAWEIPTYKQLEESLNEKK